MKKVLLIGKLNSTVGELYETLSRRFQVQISAEPIEVVEGMMSIVRPDMVLISVMELFDVDTKVFDLLCESYKDTPVLVVGTQDGCSKYEEYCRKDQFAQLVRPITKEMLLKICFRLADVKEMRIDDAKFAMEEDVMRKILVVDDSAVTLRGIKAMLEKNYQISVATSGEQALKTVKKNRPDLILLDYEMPGCDGKETLERIRADEEIKDIPVMFLTGVADKEHIAAVLKLNPAGYFLKPAERDKLLKAIEDVFVGNED